MDKNEFPSFTIREGVVGAMYPGASVKQIEQEVLKPLEDYVFSYKEVDKGKTHSQVSGNTAIIFVELDDNVDDPDSFWNEFKIGMDKVRLGLPPGVLGVETISNFGATSALLITMQSNEKTYRELGEYMDAVKDRLRSIESVGGMTVYGKQTEQIAVYFDPVKLQHYALSEKTVGATLLAQGFQTTGGALRNGSYIQPIYVARSVNSVADIADMVVFSSPDGSVVKLGDIADIKKEYEILASELEKFNPQLADKPRVLAISKSDMLDDELRAEMEGHLPEGIPHVFISAVTGQGITELKDMLWGEITDERNRIEVSPITHRPLDGHHRVREEDEFIFENVPAMPEDDDDVYDEDFEGEDYGYRMLDEDDYDYDE